MIARGRVNQQVSLLSLSARSPNIVVNQAMSKVVNKVVQIIIVLKDGLYVPWQVMFLAALHMSSCISQTGDDDRIMIKDYHNGAYLCISNHHVSLHLMEAISIANVNMGIRLHHQPMPKLQYSHSTCQKCSPSRSNCSTAQCFNASHHPKSVMLLVNFFYFGQKAIP